MDHHCPWTINCVGHRTIPHFARFLTWGVFTMLYLTRLWITRLSAIWTLRNKAYVSTNFCCRYQYVTHAAQYLGPTQPQLVLMMFVLAATWITLFFIAMLWVKTVYCLSINLTSVESWEIERHEALLKRARKNGGYVNGPRGVRVVLKRHEFPFDVGIWRNVCLSMGSGNVSSVSSLTNSTTCWRKPKTQD